MRISRAFPLAFACFAVAVTPGLAQNTRAGQNSNAVVVVPDSTVEHAADIGFRAHTNHLILVHPNAAPNATSSPSGNTPATIYPVYLGVSYPSLAGSQTIAIVDAYDYPTAENDLNVFSSQFGLPSCTTANGCFKVVYANGKKPRGNCGWNQEAALDIEWAHAMAPTAKIVLVEAASSSFSNLFAGVQAATQQVTSSGGKGEVSMSWGGSEFSSEASYDSYFQNTGVVYFGSSGDTGGKTIYPSASPYVVAAGGTSLNRDANGNFVSETGWSGSGGGPSQYEGQLSYQFGIPGVSATQRSIPDVSFDADPNTGVAVYDSTSCQGLVGWLVFGGTSVSSPSLAGIVNRAASFSTNSVTELTDMYTNYTNTNDFYDVTSGTAGSYTAGPGWDFVTGIGSSRGTGGK
ncbi:MAG: S53 family peptidase [Acidobacteriota bacterium]|nr:S53 family peptidase [Acidobacteriota bacterium]